MNQKEQKESKPADKMTKEEATALIRELTTRLGHPPSLAELETHTALRRRCIRKHFGNLTFARWEAGVSTRNKQQRTAMEVMFKVWAETVRALKKIPSIAEFEKLTKRRVNPYQTRFRYWSRVPEAMQDYVKANGLEQEWPDILEVIRERQEHHLQATAEECSGSSGRPLAIRRDRAVYGPPMVTGPLVNVPTNESGVIFLFGAMAVELGFRATLIQTEYPDCEALREMASGRWQKMKIEFEYESRNFVKHGHRAEDCDIIVCWIHNWPECPLDVVELRRAWVEMNAQLCAEELG